MKRATVRTAMVRQSRLLDQREERSRGRPDPATSIPSHRCGQVMRKKRFSPRVLPAYYQAIPRRSIRTDLAPPTVATVVPWLHGHGRPVTTATHRRKAVFRASGGGPIPDQRTSKVDPSLVAHHPVARWPVTQLAERACLCRREERRALSRTATNHDASPRSFRACRPRARIDRVPRHPAGNDNDVHNVGIRQVIHVGVGWPCKEAKPIPGDVQIYICSLLSG